MDEIEVRAQLAAVYAVLRRWRRLASAVPFDERGSVQHRAYEAAAAEIEQALSAVHESLGQPVSCEP